MAFARPGSPHLFECDFDQKISQTHLGQAHFAGTGPNGTTCRECRFFGLLKSGEQVSPGYYAKSHKQFANSLKNGLCLAPISHKARRRFPHTARSCSLFDQSDAPFPAVKPVAE